MHTTQIIVMITIHQYETLSHHEKTDPCVLYLIYPNERCEHHE